MLNRNGTDKERKAKIAQIENYLAIIARQGRAFGIHLILAVQRPDSEVLVGQIRSNFSCRICGRADQTLARVVFGNTEASIKVPDDAQGRFIMHDGTIFQGYMNDENTIAITALQRREL